ncbi:MFS transporter [Ruminococcus sp.]|uniref:MFS transporter n=1 Tax=Ruminococcus sp. TaxID=41978 RepID=UPI001B695D6C|nr:MFS transporter [Ruminococcus sp.]MBP5432099.1 MFS transporter [Ruminococcus sp.]
MNYKRTVFSCFVGYVVQAVINNFLPLLFIMLRNEYGIHLSRITLLITANFGIQLVIDLFSAFYVDRIGYRKAIIAAHIFSAAGLILLALLPGTIDPFKGVFIAVAVYAVGGGLIEVLISPIMEGCPAENKGKAMSMLHSFYCWGQVGVVLLSTLFFQIAGIERWRILSITWAAVPLINGILFIKAPIAPILSIGEKSMSFGELIRNKVFIILFVMMLCAGASELAVSQWASYFVESGLHISKAAGDLAGPMTFALLMGITRAFYGKYGHKIPLERFMLISSLVCIASYIMTGFVRCPAINLVGCGLCGLSVGIMWPGTFSKAAASLKKGGTMMFSLLALAGDVGCSCGPFLVGEVSSYTGNMNRGILSATVFPLIMTAGILLTNKKNCK